jgi:hypothetical protein
MAALQQRRFGFVYFIIAAVMLFSAPIAGVLYLDLPPGPYLQFPPETRYIIHAPFSWPVFVGLFLCIAGLCLPFILRFITWNGPDNKRGTAFRYPYPWWGWAGVAALLAFWVLAWNRFAFFSSLQQYTFTPLWIGYILAVNGLSCSRKGTCLLRSRPRFFLSLFPASALFWWYFEYLNRFVQNWFYVTGRIVSATEYVLHASICFSTVLPAVCATYEFLRTMPRLTGAFADWHTVKVAGKKWIGLFLLVGSSLCLAFLAVFPDYLFPMVWVSPLLLITGLQLVAGRATIFSGLEEGDWQRPVLAALAALICGFFWELWNWKSLAHWEYSIPFVHRFQVFAMPLPGYAGYLPFGLACIAASSLAGSGTVVPAENRKDHGT